MSLNIEQLRTEIEIIIGEKIDWSSPYSIAHALEKLMKIFEDIKKSKVFETRIIKERTLDEPEPLDESKIYDKFFESIGAENRENDQFIVTMLNYFYDNEDGAFFFGLIQGYTTARQKSSVPFLFAIQKAIGRLPLLPHDMEETLEGKTDRQKMDYLERLNREYERQMELIRSHHEATPKRTHKFE